MSWSVSYVPSPVRWCQILAQTLEYRPAQSEGLAYAIFTRNSADLAYKHSFERATTTVFIFCLISETDIDTIRLAMHPARQFHWP